MARGGQKIEADWKDFWKFVEDIGVAENAIKLRRIDESKLYGPTNFEWHKTPSKEDIVEYQANYRKENSREIRDSIFKRK